jgi:hypothetical protein
MALHEVGWIASSEGARKKEPRHITPRTTRFKPLNYGYKLDPHEWCCLTWLTLDEVKKAADLYPKHNSKGKRSGELEGILGMMRGYEKTKIMQTRLVLWFQ